MSLLSRHLNTTNSLRCCRGASGTPCVAIKQRSRRAGPDFRRVTAAASVHTLPAAAAEAAAATAPNEAVEPITTTQQPASAAQRTSSSTITTSNASSSSSSGEGLVTVRVGANTNRTAVAGFILKSFQEKGDGLTVFVQAVGAAACAQALRAVARLQQMVAEDPTADHCVVFKVRRFRSELQRNGEEQAVDPATGEGMSLNGYQLILTLGRRTDWPAAAFDTSDSREAGKAASADSSSNTSDGAGHRRSSSKSSSSSSSSDAGSAQPLIPTTVKASTKDETQRLTKHAMRASELKLPAQFMVAGSKQNFDVSAIRLFSALNEARRQAFYLDEPADMLCTITSIPYTVQVTPRSSSDSKEGQQSDAAAGEAAAPAAAAAATDADAAKAAAPKPAAAGTAGSDAADADADTASTTRQRVRYVVTVQRCGPGRKAVAAAKRRKQQADNEAAAGKELPAARGRSKVRPGYIEVKEEEWNQLKEQLAVVPHLTEQLQIMTRQHEQLLSLLAAQQGQQQEAA